MATSPSAAYGHEPSGRARYGPGATSSGSIKAIERRDKGRGLKAGVWSALPKG